MALWWVVLLVLTHEKPHAEVVAQNFGLHQLVQGTAKAHRYLDSLRHSCFHLIPWNVG
jgi:hypothetical protein